MQISAIYEGLQHQKTQLESLQETVADALVVNSYLLLEVEAQLRNSKSPEEEPEDTGLQTA